MKILITGGAGFIGSHTVDLLINKGHKVVIIDNLSTGKNENLNIKAKFYKEDLNNFEKISEIFETEKPEVVYHFAAQIDVRKSVENPVSDAQTNILAAINLLELCVKHNIQHFIFSSTGGAIYGEAETPTTENIEPNPISPYGCAKLSIEKYLNYYNKIHGLKYTILRYANVYGPRQNSKGEAGVVAIFFDKIIANENPKIYGGLQTRDFVYVKDVALANMLALTDKESNVYNVGTSKESDIISIFSKINYLFNNKSTVEYLEKKKGEQQKSCLSYKKINEFLGWFPTVTIDEGLGQIYLDYLKKNISNQY
ncbi:MAG TPA: NAD-dependent epimerase/dehydratase family protein [Candidatus Paceibacterota bacterium]|nr:NAD-dependent epimerase/dehydratase family protein [Candidatus Paceibacterota bacterium]